MPIRSFTPEDYEPFAAFLAYAKPQRARSAVELRALDQNYGQPQRWLWADDHGMRGALVVKPKFGAPRDHLVLEVLVHPQDHDAARLDTLFAHLQGELAALGPAWVFSEVDEADQVLADAFVRQGFRVSRHEWNVVLDLKRFDPTPFREASLHAHDSGYTLRHLGELQDDPERDHRVYHLNMALLRDVPGNAHFDHSYDSFLALSFENPAFRPEGWVVALHGGQYVGLHRVWANPDGPRVGLTGVLPAHRRRGVATALKLRGIAFAQTLGFSELRAEHDAENQAILDLDRRMGFVKRGGTIEFVNDLGRH